MQLKREWMWYGMVGIVESCCCLLLGDGSYKSVDLLRRLSCCRSSEASKQVKDAYV